MALAFVAVAVASGLISGAMVLAFEMYQGSVEAKSAAQEMIVEITQTEVYQHGHAADYESSGNSRGHHNSGHKGGHH